MRIFLAIFFTISCASAASAFEMYGVPPASSGEHGSSSSSGSDSNRFVLTFSRSGDDEQSEENHEESGHGEEAVEEDAHGGEVTEDIRSISLPTVVVPLSRNDRLTGFAFVTVAWRVGDGLDIWAARDKAHIALDALIRSAYATSLSNEDGTGVDWVRAEEVWVEALRSSIGENWVDKIELSGSDTRLLGRR